MFDIVTVLHIEDSALVRELISEVMKIKGLIVVPTNSIGTAIDRALNVRFDLAIIDTELPDGLSFNFLSEIKEAVGADVPIIATSGESDYAKKWQQLIDEGQVFAFLPKPFSVASLDEMITLALGLKADEQTDQCPDCGAWHALTECCQG